MTNTLIDFIARFLLFAILGAVIIGVRPGEVFLFAVGCAGFGYIIDTLYGSTRSPKKHAKRVTGLFAGRLSSGKDRMAWLVLMFCTPLTVLFVTALLLSVFVGREASWVWAVGALAAVMTAWLLMFLAPRRSK